MSAATYALPGMDMLTSQPLAPAVDDSVTVLAFDVRHLPCGCVVEVPAGLPTAFRCGARLLAPCAEPRLRDSVETASRDIPRGWLLDGMNTVRMHAALNLIAHHVDCGLRARR